jgi:hypothetical protein
MHQLINASKKIKAAAARAIQLLNQIAYEKKTIPNASLIKRPCRFRFLVSIIFQRYNMSNIVGERYVAKEKIAKIFSP